MSDVILTETDEFVTTVTLNRPDALNALSTALRRALTDTFIALREDETTRVIILTGSGRAFSAGLDLKELGQQGLGRPGESAGGVDLADAMMNVGKPIIGAINGFAITGGFEIALLCDILIASTQARFADTHVHMGVVPGWGLSQRLARLIGASRAREMSLTGNYLDASTAERWGLVNRVLPPEDLLPHCRGLAREICATDQPTMREVHRLINFGLEHDLAQGLAEERRASAAHGGDRSAAGLEHKRNTVQARGRNLNA